jgi:hypothetical protein
MPNIIRLDEGYRLDEGHRLDEPAVNPPAPPAPVPPHKEKGKHMDMIPRPRDAQSVWYKNLSDNAVAEAVKFGGDPAQALAAKAAADAVLGKMAATNTQANLLDSTRQLEADTKTASDAAIRAIVRNWKTLPGYAASGSEAILRLKGPADSFDPATFKPSLKVTVEPGQNRLTFNVAGCDGVKVWYRLRGTLPWHFIGFDSSAPYYDSTPLAAPAVAEVREYKIRGVINDVEIGLESDIVSATFAG